MKVSKWVDMGQEVEVDIGVGDIRVAIDEAFASVTEDRMGEPGPNATDIKYALNRIAEFLKALTSEHIELLGEPAQKMVQGFLEEQAARFAAISGGQKVGAQ